MLGLRKATNPVVFRDITNQLFVRLAKNSYEIYSLRQDEKALSKARIFKYKYETKSGLTEDAEKTKREIAREGLVTRFKKIFSANDASRNDGSNFIEKIALMVSNFIYGLYSLVRYFVGFLLITFPFDGAFIIAGLIILSIEGRAQIKKEFLITPKLKTSKIWYWMFLKLSVYKIQSSFSRLVNDLVFGVQMLAYYYTSDSANRNVRIGSSLLIFGLGLFFSSARTMVESFVAQMSI